MEEPFPSFLSPSLQVRPRDEPEGRFYDPGRDVAHLGDPLLGIACGMIDDDVDLRTLRETLAISDAQMLSAVRALVAFTRLPEPDADGNYKPLSFAGHVKETKLDEADPLAKMLLYAAIGELFMAAAWQGKRAAAVYDSSGRAIAKVDTGHDVARAARDLIESLPRRRPWGDRLRLAARMLIRGK